MVNCDADIFLLIDTSGSMEGRKQECVEKILLYLNSESWMVIGVTFHIHFFDSSLNFKGKFEKGTMLVEVPSEGGTDIESSLKGTIDYIQELKTQRPGLLLLITDAEDEISDPGGLKSKIDPFLTARNNDNDFFVTTFLFLNEGSDGCHKVLEEYFHMETVDVATFTQDSVAEVVYKAVREIIGVNGERNVTNQIGQDIQKAEEIITDNEKIVTGVIEFDEVLQKSADLFEHATGLYELAEGNQISENLVENLEQTANQYNQLVDQYNALPVAPEKLLDKAKDLTDITKEIASLEKEVKKLAGDYDNLAKWCSRSGISKRIMDGVNNLTRAFKRSSSLQELQDKLFENAKTQMRKFVDTNETLKQSLEKRKETLENKYQSLKEAVEKLTSTNVRGLKDNLQTIGEMLQEIQGSKKIKLKMVLKFIAV